MNPPFDSINLNELSPHAFGEQTERYRHQLHLHCYRMLGSVLDAEELVQETFSRAWRHRATFAGRSSLRNWLYKIATNLCLNALHKRARRTLPVARQAAADLDEPIPPDLNEPIWLEPFPDALIASETSDPAVRFAQRERVSLAFLTALQRLPPRQRAVLILRDVLDWPASEVADLLEITVAAVKSALFRARTTLAAHYRPTEIGDAPLEPVDEVLRQRLEKYVHAWETANIEELVTLLTADATFSMPPIPAWYQGRATIAGLVGKTVFRGAANGRWRLQATRANGQFAFGLYRVGESPNVHEAYGIQVVRFAAGAIADITTFRLPELFAKFGLPITLTPTK